MRKNRAIKHNASRLSRTCTPVTVVGGDTLSAIAQRWCGDADLWPDIYRVNQTTIVQQQRRYGGDTSEGPHLIYPGTVLLIPNHLLVRRERTA